MLTYIIEGIKNVFSFKKNDTSNELTEDSLAEEILKLELENENTNKKVDLSDISAPLSKCFEKTGTVTSFSMEYILIDDKYYFNLDNYHDGSITEDDRIRFLCYKDQYDKIVVVKILEVYGGQEEYEYSEIEDSCFDVIDHVIVGEVESRFDRMVYIKSDEQSDLKFNLDDVASSIIPKTGDWLELRCTVKHDLLKPTKIGYEEVLEVMSIKPVRTKVISCRVTQWDGTTGLCDYRHYFDRDSMRDEFSIEVGTQVIIEAIESTQGIYHWRVVNMTPDDPFKVEDKRFVVDEEKLSLDTENDRKVAAPHSIVFNNISLTEPTLDQCRFVFNITNNSDKTYEVKRWKLLSKKISSQVIIKPFIVKPIMLHPKQHFNLTIACTPKFLGASKEMLIIVLNGFNIKRWININVVANNIAPIENKSYIHNNSKRATFEAMKNIRDNPNQNVMPGVKNYKGPAFVTTRLEQFPIPEKLWNTFLGDYRDGYNVNDHSTIMCRLQRNYPDLLSNMDISNYTTMWHTLLHLEEIQQSIQMRSYDLPSAFMDIKQEYLTLEIKGLSERRPSLIVGDKVIAKHIWNETEPNYEGYIHIIKGDKVFIKFHSKFHQEYTGYDMAFEFHFNRSAYRRLHFGVNAALRNLGSEILFPNKIYVNNPQISQEKFESIEWFNEQLNDMQKSAVRNILLGECRPLPYCIFGPPGTGKTITLVETILQILSNKPDSRILVSAPSNSACNILTEHLIVNNKRYRGSIKRLVAHYLLDSDAIPDIVKPYCSTLDVARDFSSKSNVMTNKDGITLNSRTSHLSRHRVVIGTCVCLGTLALMGLPKSHFTHIIIDEAGQATEPEIMIPMSFVPKNFGQIILAGDPKQLGPVVISNVCKEYGMDQSYFCRILERFPYQRDTVAFASQDGYDKRLVTKLINNYRSISDVLTLPSEMFYSSTLVPEVDPTQPHIEEMLEKISQAYFDEGKSGGIFVHGIRGNDSRAEDSPSWYNPEEAATVAMAACKLYKNSIKPDDIGIISPYIAQTKYIRKLFDALGSPQPKIGTVEEFQGQERSIIMITTVRSKQALIEEDAKYTLGFISNPKRVNVALTRAKVQVMIFCNPHLLSQDAIWKKIIHCAVDSDNYKGCDLPSQFIQ